VLWRRHLQVLVRSAFRFLITPRPRGFERDLCGLLSYRRLEAFFHDPLVFFFLPIPFANRKSWFLPAILHFNCFFYPIHLDLSVVLKSCVKGDVNMPVSVETIRPTPSDASSLLRMFFSDLFPASRCPDQPSSLGSQLVFRLKQFFVAKAFWCRESR